MFGNLDQLHNLEEYICYLNKYICFVWLVQLVTVLQWQLTSLPVDKNTIQIFDGKGTLKNVSASGLLLIQYSLDSASNAL